MPHCFVKQPDGNLAIWSTVVDNFISLCCTADEAIQEELQRPQYANYPGNIREDLCRELENIAKTGRAWKWAPTWAEALETISEQHGAAELAEVLLLYSDRDDVSVFKIHPLNPDAGKSQQIVSAAVGVVFVDCQPCEDRTTVEDQSGVMAVGLDAMVQTAQWLVVP